MALLRAIHDHLLRLLPSDPADAKRLDDIVDPGDGDLPLGQRADEEAESTDPGSRVRSKTWATKRAAR